MIQHFKIKNIHLNPIRFLLCTASLFVIFACSSSDKYKVLIIGDSISNGYYPTVRRQLRSIADVQRIQGNGEHTRNGLQKIEEWVGEEKWDLILFNWGLWDACYRMPNPDGIGEKDKFNGQQDVPLDEYKANLDTLVNLLQTTGAKLVFITSTYIPEGEPGIFSDDVPIFNDAAAGIMKKNSVVVLDIYQSSVEIHKKYGKGLNNAHFTKRGYAFLGNHISDFLMQELK